MTTEDALELLQISRTTLYRRIKSGQYQVTKGVGKFSADSFTHAGLGLPEPTPEPTAEVISLHCAEKSKPEPVRVIGEITEPRNLTGRPDNTEEQDAAFAAAYRAGEATDSIGNTIDGQNKRFPSKGAQSLIGVPRPEETTPLDTQAHMNKALLGTYTSDGQRIQQKRHSFESGEGFTRGGVALCAGLSQETYDAMMKSHDKRGGRPSMSQQAEAVWRAEENIRRAFPKGERT